MNNIAMIFGYIILTTIGIAFLYGLMQYALYGEIGESISQKIVGNKVYINGKLVAETKDTNISIVNGSVYEDGKLIYKHKKKFRWEK